MINWMRNKLFGLKHQAAESGVESVIRLTESDPPLQRLMARLELLQKADTTLDRRALMISRVGLIQNSFEFLNHELVDVNQYLLTANTINNLRLRFDEVLTGSQQPLTEVLGDDPVAAMRMFVSRASVFTHLISNFNMEDVYPRVESMINKNIVVLDEICIVLLRSVR